MNIRRGEIPYDSSNPMIVWVVLKANIMSLFRAHGGLLVGESRVRHKPFGADGTLSRAAVYDEMILQMEMFLAIAIVAGSRGSFHLGQSYGRRIGTGIMGE